MNRKEVYILAIITFLTVFFWIIFSIYHANDTTRAKNIELKELVPLTPTFDNEIINQLDTREDF